MLFTISLRSCDLQPNVLWHPLPDFLGQAIVDVARAQACSIDYGRRRGGRDGDNQPNQGGERKTRERRQFQPERMARLKVANHTKRQQKDCSRNRSQRNQSQIDATMQPLPAAATSTRCQMLFVVTAHFWRQAGDIVPPACQNPANHGINALTHKQLQPNSLHRFSLLGQKHPVLQQRSAGA